MPIYVSCLSLRGLCETWLSVSRGQNARTFHFHFNLLRGRPLLALNAMPSRCDVGTCLIHALLQVDGESHVLHVEEEATGTRLSMGPATCLLAKEADPSRIIATSPGRSIQGPKQRPRKCILHIV